MTVGEQFEYRKLNAEIQGSDGLQMGILGFVFTVSVTVLGYGLGRGDSPGAAPASAGDRPPGRL